MATGRVCKDLCSACVLGPSPLCLDSSSGLAQGSVPAQLITPSLLRTQALYTEEHAVSSQPTVTGGQFSLFASCYSLLPPCKRAPQASAGGTVPWYYSILAVAYYCRRQKT